MSSSATPCLRALSEMIGAGPTTPSYLVAVLNASYLVDRAPHGDMRTTGPAALVCVVGKPGAACHVMSLARSIPARDFAGCWSTCGQGGKHIAFLHTGDTVNLFEIREGVGNFAG